MIKKNIHVKNLKLRFLELNVNKEFFTYKVLRYFGIILIAISITIWTLTIIELKGLEIMLSNSQNYELTIEEIWSYEGALNWWKETYNSIIYPSSLILTITGIIVIFSPKIYSITQDVLPKTNFPNIQNNRYSTENSLMREVKKIKGAPIKKPRKRGAKKKNFALIREKWQNKIEKDIQNKENNIQKLRIEINDLKYIRDELDKFQLLSHEKR